MTYSKSPLRYPGGKSRAIKLLKDYFFKYFREYREPFFGGGSVGLYLLQSTNYKNAMFYANDLNYDLYCFWQILKTRSVELIQEIQNVKNSFKCGRNLYEILIKRRDSIDDFQRAIDFFILNRITFSGVVDSGGYSQKAFQSRFTQSSIERLKEAAQVIQGFQFSNSDYADLILKNGKDVFIFLDPPYFSATKSKLYGKKGSLHTSFDHKRLCETLKSTSHTFLLTYDDSEFIRELYKDFYIQELQIQYGMNNYKQKYAPKGNEILISNRKFCNSLLDEL